MKHSVLTGEPMVPVLYLDMDAIRWGKHEMEKFIDEPRDVRVFDGVADMLLRYKQLGWRVVGTYNEGRIALGRMTMKTCAEIMVETQNQVGGAFDKIAWCSHHPDANTPEMAICWCRKPRIGLIIETMLDLAGVTGEIYPPHLGLFVSGRPEDVQTAQNAALQFMTAEEWREGKHLSGLITVG